MAEKNLFSWTALISGLVQSGQWIDGFNLFIEMRRAGVHIVDPFILSSIVGASANLAALELGKQIHCLVLSLGYESSLFVSNALVDMYAKCSNILAAKTIFDTMCRRDIVSWTSIIVGMAQHGRANESLSLYDEMISAGLKPNKVTFVGLIYACSHVGLVSKGHLDEAENLLKTMPFKPHEAAWAALLSACKRHGNTEMGV
ncbi:Pentatricopeptide repeat-containing protein [Camellia lanceoleosa]|nr:Pentatricopeptide repeat-containing protein [Camellia lanceoleosa]